MSNQNAVVLSRASTRPLVNEADIQDLVNSYDEATTSTSLTRNNITPHSIQLANQQIPPPENYADTSNNFQSRVNSDTTIINAGSNSSVHINLPQGNLSSWQNNQASSTPYYLSRNGGILIDASRAGQGQGSLSRISCEDPSQANHVASSNIKPQLRAKIAPDTSSPLTHGVKFRPQNLPSARSTPLSSSEWEEESGPKGFFSAKKGTSTIALGSIDKPKTDEWMPVATDNLRVHVNLDRMNPTTLDYMRTVIFKSSLVIPLWEPTPATRECKNWRWNACVGDIGYFTDHGGFQTLFNVFLTAEENIGRGHKPPEEFIPYPNRVKIRYIREVPVYESDIVCYNGFKQSVGKKNEGEVCTMHIPKSFRKTKCAANYMSEGHIQHYIDTTDLTKVQAYLGSCHETWCNFVPYDADMPTPNLVFVASTFKTTSWSIACSTTQHNSDSRDPVYATLRRGDRYPHAMHWFSNNNKIIHRKYGPSPETEFKMEEYISSPEGQSAGPDAIAEMRECFCVGLEGYTYDESRGTDPTARLATRSSRLSVTSIMSKLSFFSTKTIRRGG